MEENKRKKGGLSGFIMLALVIGIMVGANHWTNIKNDEKLAETIKNDDSYKVITNKDKSYNGFYSLTKLDDKGNNTWDGLLIYAKKDRIMAATLVDYMTLDEAKKKYHLGDTIKNAFDFSEADIMPFYTEYQDRWANKSDIQSHKLGGSFNLYEFPNRIVGVRNVVSYGVMFDGKIDVRENIDMQKDYEILKDMELVPAYDEKSNELWLSKLLKNKNSEYHKGYKLRKYKNATDVYKNCKIADESIMGVLNDRYNAGLDES